MTQFTKNERSRINEHMELRNTIDKLMLHDLEVTAQLCKDMKAVDILKEMAAEVSEQAQGHEFARNEGLSSLNQKLKMEKLELAKQTKRHKKNEEKLEVSERHVQQYQLKFKTLSMRYAKKCFKHHQNNKSRTTAKVTSLKRKEPKITVESESAQKRESWMKLLKRSAVPVKPMFTVM